MTHDALVLGAGPSGCSAATALARAGRSVLLVDRDMGPRFKIGESLLPRNMPLFEELGLMEKIEAAGFQKKYGALFTNEATGGTRQVIFRESWSGDYPSASRGRRRKSVSRRSSPDPRRCANTSLGRGDSPVSRPSRTTHSRRSVTPETAARSWAMPRRFSTRSSRPAFSSGCQRASAPRKPSTRRSRRKAGSRFYDPIFARMFCEEAPIDAMCAAVTSVLAGDVERPALAVRLLNRITLLLIGLARFFERPAEQRPLAAAG